VYMGLQLGLQSNASNIIIIMISISPARAWLP
jgi:hypothetical protein